MAKSRENRRYLAWIAGRKETGIFLAMLAIFTFFSILSPYFFKLENLINVLRQVSLLGIIAMGMSLVIVCAEIDLSVGSLYGASAILTGVMLVNGIPLWLAIVLGLATGTLFGLLNGFLITYGRIPALIVTLGMMNIARGLALIVSNGRVVNLSPRTVSDPHLDFFLFLGQGKVLTLPVMCIFFIAASLAVYLLFGKTILGFRMKAVGGSRNAARASGINERLIKIAAFGILGFLSALAGLLNISFLGNVQGTTGQGMELNAIAAVIIGGTSLSGGEGTIIGTLIGVLIMGILNNGIILLGVSPFLQMTIIGIVIIVAVALDIWTRKGSRN
jgi:ribose/xylose/arabinose/galactoside ABC-type transport system permease subunit